METPKVDRRITEPWHVPFLEWYDGIFNAVFIALHPFWKLEGIHPSDAPRPVIVVSASDLSPGPLTVDKLNAMHDDYKQQFTIDLKTLQHQEKQHGEKVSWQFVKDSCQFGSLGQLSAALKTGIMALQEAPARASDAAKLEAFCAEHKIFLPTEDTIPPLIESEVANLLQLMEIDELIVADEFGSDTIRLKTEQLMIDMPWKYSQLYQLRANKIYSDDHSFLLITPYDNFYTALCGDRERLKAAKVEEAFEGSWCDNKTILEWWSQ
jgi:hypothetical protein